MAPTETDLRTLARPLVVPAIAALLGIALLAGTFELARGWLADRERAYREARAELSRAASQYRNASDDRAVYEQYAARFREMRERGWIGPEERLSWIEALRQINETLELPQLRFDIAQRQSVSPGALPYDTSRLRPYRTPMNLRLGALHERDVLDLLDALGERGAGLLSIRACSLRRAGSGDQVQLSPDVTNVEASCAVHWYGLEIVPEEGGTE